MKIVIWPWKLAGCQVPGLRPPIAPSDYASQPVRTASGVSEPQVAFYGIIASVTHHNGKWRRGRANLGGTK